MSPRAAIFAEIERVRENVKNSFKIDDKRIALLELFRCIDYHFFVEYEDLLTDQAHPDPSSVQEVDRLFKWGWNEAIRLFWDGDIQRDGTPVFQSWPELKIWGDQVLQTSGRIRLAELVLELERLRLGEFNPSQHGGETYNFHYANDATGVEFVELSDENFLQTAIGKMHERNGVWEALGRRRSAVFERMAKMVKPHQDHFIRYSAHPMVDEFYGELAAAISSMRTGWNTFPLETVFGGMSFAAYLTGVQTLVGFALKHLDFCLLLAGRRPEIDPTNIVAYPFDWSPGCSYLASALDCTQTEAEKIMLATSITSENASIHLETPTGPPPMHFVIGKGSAVRLIRGCLDNPFHFLLRELHRKFPRDWDVAVNVREEAFRKDLFALLVGYGDLRFVEGNINISTDLGATDIDAIIYDPPRKTAAFFQLKWQEPFAGSMRERESRKKNFLNSSNIWVEKVHSWIASGKMSETLTSAGVPRRDATAIVETHLFVLGRTFSHFSGAYAADPRAAWGTWAQVARLVAEAPLTGSPLRKLNERLRQDAPTLRAPKDIHAEEIALGGLKIRMGPHPNDS